ncbi:MAG: hypothetical protein IIX75_03100 [Clostridia bacterium]|nr:hypothetical protein [Clostridia bacterium]
MDRDLVLGQWKRGDITINVYEYDGIALYNESTAEYFANSMALLDKEIANGLFHGHHDIYTKVRDRVPSFYGENCDVENCLVADGSTSSASMRSMAIFIFSGAVT